MHHARFDLTRHFSSVNLHLNDNTQALVKVERQKSNIIREYHRSNKVLTGMFEKS